MELTQKLEMMAGALEEMLKDGMTIPEMISFAMALGSVIAEFSPGAAYEVHKAQCVEAWAWAEAKWGLIARVNLKFELPFIPEEEEAKMLEAFVEKFILPVMATVMSLKTLSK